MKKLLFSCILLAVVYGCKKEKTSWKTDHLIPLINDSLTLKNVIKDVSITNDGFGMAVLNIDREIFSLDPSKLVKIPDTTITQKYAISFGSITIQPGFSFVNSVVVHDFNIESAQLKKIILKQGTIKLKVTNPVATKSIFNVSLPGVSKDGIILSKSINVPAKANAVPGEAQIIVDLTGYEINLTGPTGASFNKIQSIMQVSSDPDGNTVNVTSLDSTKFNATFSDLKVDYARGYFGQISIIDSVAQNISALANIQSGSIDISNLNLQFQLLNGLKVPAQIKINQVSNTNSLMNTIILSNSNLNTFYNINEATGQFGSITSSVYSLIFNSGNSNIEQFIENLGSNLKLKYELKLNPWGNTSGGWNEVFPGSKVSGRIIASLPLNIGINQLVLKDTFALKITNNTSKSHVSAGQFILKAQNGFPIEFNMVLKVIKPDNTFIEIQSLANVKSSIIGSLDASLGIQVAKSELIYQIPSSILENLKEYTRMEIKGTVNSGTSVNPTNQAIPEKAFLGVKLFADFTYTHKI